MEDFYINDHGASEFGALLLSSWYVSGSTLTQNYLTSYTGSRITFCSTQYGLRSISLPVDIYGASPADAAAKRSALTAAFLGGTVELALPDGGTYTALLLDSGKAQESRTPTAASSAAPTRWQATGTGRWKRWCFLRMSRPFLQRAPPRRWSVASQRR